MLDAYPLDQTYIFIYLSLQEDVGVNQYVHQVDEKSPSVRFSILKNPSAKFLIRRE